MSSTVQCPDDLFVLRRRRPLTASEERELAEHVAHCESCRMSQALHAGVEPLPPIDDVDAEWAARWVSRTLAPRAVPEEQEAPGDEQARVVARMNARQRSSKRWAAASAVLVLFASAAGATVWRQLFPAAPEPAEPQSPAASAAPARAKASKAAPGPEIPEAPTPEPSTSEAFTPRAASAEVSAAPMPPRIRVPDAVPPPVAAPPRPAATPTVGESQQTAAELFVEANRARRRRQFTDAARLYRELQGSFPQSEEAALSLLSLADLLFAQGQADAALEKFDAYLASSNAALAEEALVGRARALAQLGRGKDERDAWQALLTRYPQSTYAWRAQQRIKELGVDP